MIQLFNTILVSPLFNFLVYIYDVIGDIGIAIIILTLIVKIILFPLTKKSIKSQRELQILQPKIKEIQEKYKKDKQQMTQEMLKMYKKHKVNPLGGCLPILIQLPILLALYQVFRKGFESSSLDFLYSFISNPGIINPFFLNIVNLAETSLILAIIAAIAQYFQGYFMQAKMKLLPVQDGNKADFAQIMQKQMLYMMPIMILVFSLSLPSALPLYWIVNTLFTLGQEIYIKK